MAISLLGHSIKDPRKMLRCLEMAAGPSVSLCTSVFLTLIGKLKAKAVPLHSTRTLGGEEV
jgi:hypothetical protein